MGRKKQHSYLKKSVVVSYIAGFQMTTSKFNTKEFSIWSWVFTFMKY